MNKKSPDIVLKCKFNLALNHRDNKFQDKNYKQDREKDVEDMIDYFSNPKESATGMIDYYAGKLSGKKYNLVLENGEYANKQDIKKLKKDYQKYIKDSNLWKGIISFNNPYIYENISLKTLEQKFAKEIMPQFLKYCGFKNSKDMSYVFAIHTKSKSRHIHIHFSFIEKKPNYMYSKNKINYRRMGTITADEKNYLKRLVALTIEREKYYTPLLTKTNEDIDELKTYFNPSDKNFILENSEELFIEEKILKLGALLKQYRQVNNNTGKKIKYNSIKDNSIGKEIKELTKDIKKYLFQNENSLLYDSQKEIDEDLKNINSYFDKINDDLNIKELVGNVGIVKTKQDYIDNYVYNSIVNHSLYKYNKVLNTVKTKKQYEKITMEDLIQELAYQNSLNDEILNDKQRRKKILSNYFKSNDLKTKFPSKYKMESALRKINYEMEQSADKFSELFNYSNTKIKRW